MLHTSAESVFTGDRRTLYLHTYNYISEHCTVTCSNIRCPLTLFISTQRAQFESKIDTLKETNKRLKRSLEKVCTYVRFIGLLNASVCQLVLYIRMYSMYVHRIQ